MPLKGNIRDFKLEEIIKFIGLGKKTGALELNHGREAAVFYFKNGNLYFVHRNTKPVSITEKVLTSGTITEEDAEKIRSGKVFPPEALESDDETKSKIAEILKEILIEQATEVFLWNEAEFVFKNNEKRTGEDWGVYLNTDEFIEKVKKHTETLKKFTEKAKSVKTRLNFRQDVNDDADIIITGKEWKLISSLKPGMTVEEAASASGIPLTLAIDIVSNLVDKSLLVLEEVEHDAHVQEKTTDTENQILAEKKADKEESHEKQEYVKDRYEPAKEAKSEPEESFDEENLINELAAITGNLETSIDANSLAKNELERILKTLDEL